MKNLGAHALLGGMLIAMLLCTQHAQAQWAAGTAITWQVDGSVNNLNYDPGTANVQAEIENIMSSIADDWIVACGLNLSISQGYSTRHIKIKAGDLSHLPGIALGWTDPIPRFCTSSQLEVVITINWGANFVYRDAVDPIYMRDITSESAPYQNLDIRSVLLHELAHAFGMNGEGGIGVLLGTYHGSDREIDAQEAGVYRWIYSSCQSFPNFQWQRTRTSFDNLNPYDSSPDGRLSSNKWSPYTYARPMSFKPSGWTVNWVDGDAPPTVNAELYQEPGSIRWKFHRWSLDEHGQYGSAYDNEVVLEAHTQLGVAEYAQTYDYTLHEGQYCDGSVAQCYYEVDNVQVSTPYTGDMAPEFEGARIIEVTPADYRDAFLYWIDEYGQKFYSSLMNLNVEDRRSLTPVFQKHLTSNNAVSDFISESGTSSNNQRKVAFVDGSPGVHHQVYESCGRIFYSNSSDMGQNWTTEYRLSDISSTTNENPSIFADVDSVWVVWKSDSQLRLIKFNANNPSAWLEYDVSNAPTPRDGCTPVITRTGLPSNSYVVLAYETNTGCEVNWVLLVDGFYHNHGSVSSTMPNNLQVEPSIVKSGSNGFQLVWRDGDEVYLRMASIASGGGGWNVLWNQTEMLVPFGGRPAVGPPTVSCPATSAYGGSIYSAIACETGASSPTGVSLTFNKGGAMFWHVQTFIIANEEGRLWAPSISFLDETAVWSGFEHFRLAFNYTDSFVSGNPTVRQVWVMKPEFDSGGNLIDYPIEIQGPEALHPSIVTQPPAGDNLSIFTGLTGGYSNTIENEHQGLNKTATQIWKRNRELSLRMDTTLVVIGLGNLRVANGNENADIAWFRHVDSSIIGRDISVQDDFRTEAFDVVSGSRLTFWLKDMKNGQTQFPNNVQLRLEVREYGTNSLLGIIGTLTPSTMATGKRVANINQSLHYCFGKKVYLQLRADGITNAIGLHAHDIWSYETIDSTNFPKLDNEYENGSSLDLGLGHDYLAQNYPNPFNPSTSIEYYVQTAGWIKLAVSDISGREVQVLREGYMDAGLHTESFDASKLPSGTYVYRLVTQQGSQIRRMNLIK
jgi:hypothetical protein